MLLLHILFGYTEDKMMDLGFLFYFSIIYGLRIFHFFIIFHLQQTYTFTLRATDAESQTADRQFTITVSVGATGGGQFNKSWLIHN